MAPPVVRWGILAPGGIAQTFARDLTIDPRTRGVADFRHQVVAAASSSSVDKAQAFLQEIGVSEAKAYGSYADLVADPDVDIVYIASPHSHHYQHAMLCLEAGKPVLCEKALTANAAQARRLVEMARQKKLLLMEGLWTRYFPLSAYVRDLVTSGAVGPVMRVFADNGVAQDFESEEISSGKSRMVNPDLAGGALLDLGVYALAWVFQTLYFTQPEEQRRPPRVTASVVVHEPTRVDATSAAILDFARPAAAGGTAQAVATSSLTASAEPAAGADPGPAVRIQGPKGEIQVWPPIYRPMRTRVIYTNGAVEDKTFPIPGPGAGSGFYNGFGASKNAEGEGHGMFWEADAAARALLAGEKEGACLGLDESVVIMDVMDAVRAAGTIVYPEAVETTAYPFPG